MSYVFPVAKKFDSWSDKCDFRSFFGSFPVEFLPEKTFLGYFYNTKKFVFEFQGDSAGGVSSAVFELSCSFPPLSAF